MKRREFLKGLAAAQLGMLTAQIGCHNNDATAPTGVGARGPDKVTQRLNVVVHGMFAIVVDQKGKLGDRPGVYLKAPEVSGHHFVAKAFTADNGNLKPASGWETDYEVPQLKLIPDKISFSRKKESTIYIDNRLQDRIIVDVSQHMKRKATDPWWTVDLPVPDEIWPLRATRYNCFDPRYPSYTTNGMSPSQECPLVYVLTYNVDTGSQVLFDSGQNSRVVPIVGGIGRLHLFAEPNGDEEKNLTGKRLEKHLKKHLIQAVDALDELFNPALSLHYDPTKDVDTGLPRDEKINVPCTDKDCVLLCEERSLEESKLDCDAFLKQPTFEQFYLDQNIESDGLKRGSSHSPRRLDAASLKAPRNCMSVIAAFS